MPPLPPKKPDTLRKVEYRVLTHDACKKLVLTHHYSHRLPTAVKLVYGLVDYGPPRQTVACCLFSIPPSRWSEEVWELSRLVRLPDYDEPLTRLISAALGHLRRSKEIDLIVSFADTEEDHHGGIYQAASWVYTGMRGERLDGFEIDGGFVPARTVFHQYGTTAVAELQKQLKGQDVQPHFDKGKHCYWKALTKGGMQKAIRCGLQSRPYPKPMLAPADTSEGTPEARNYVIDPQTRKGKVSLPDLKREAPQAAKRVILSGPTVSYETKKPPTD